jgi:DNA helicase-2/ATP-dependent DNA helicase PcrA
MNGFRVDPRLPMREPEEAPGASEETQMTSNREITTADRALGANGQPTISTRQLKGNLQLIACAGAGKTQRVAERVVAQLDLPGVTPENVVAFTFNERAAAELKERIAGIYEGRRGTREGLADLYVGTIHGYCLELLQRHAFDALAYNVLDDVQQRLLISRNCSKVGLTSVLGWLRYRNAGTFAEMVSVLREGDVDLKKLDGTAAADCLERYCALLHEKKYFDFTSIMSEAVAFLEDDPDFRARVAGTVRYLTVDEYQDVNPLQERLIRQLADLGADVTVVGDDDQLLYAWRGSAISNILEFEDRYPAVSVDRLEQNFRSSRGIVDLARSVIERNDPNRLSKAMVSAGNQVYEEGDIELAEFGPPQDEASYIAKRIEQLLGTPFQDLPTDEARGLSWGDMAILVRSRRLMPEIVAALEAHEIPYVVAGLSSSLFDAAEACAARELFYFLAGESDEGALRKAWKDSELGLSKSDLDRGLKLAREDRADIVEGSGRFGVYNLQRSFLRFLEAIELREEKVIGASHAHAHARSEVVYYNLGKVSQAISDFEQIHFHSDPKRKYEGFAGFLRFQAEDIYPEGWLDAKYVAVNAVQILTIHQAKGLQWPAVFVPGLTKGRFPGKGGGGRTPWHAIPDGVVRNAADYKDSEENERRVFYVACTRAKKYLSLTRAIYPTEKRQWATPSVFWDEAQEAFASLADPEPRPQRAKLEAQPRRSVEDVLLSFSELRYAFECPYSFKLRFLYGFNPPLAEPLGYGKGLHDALFELHVRALHGGDTSEDAAEELIARHMNLRFAYRELEKELTESGVKRLRAYIRARSADFDDIEHAERPIEIDLGGGVVVNGRIDLIRRKSTDEVVVIDFKSNDRTQQEEVTDLQLRLYALGYRQATGQAPTSVVVDNLDDLDNPRVEAVTDAMLAEAAGAVKVAATQMRDNDYGREPRGATVPAKTKTCERCDLAGICGTHEYAS